MPNPRSAGNERATVPRRRTPGNGRRETPRRVESGAESRVDNARTLVGILRPFAVCRAGARDEEGARSGALGHSASFKGPPKNHRVGIFTYSLTNCPCVRNVFPHKGDRGGDRQSAPRAEKTRENSLVEKGCSDAAGSARLQTAARVLASRILWRVGRDSRRAGLSGARCSLPPPWAVPPRDGPPRAPRRCGRSGEGRKSPREGWR